MVKLSLTPKTATVPLRPHRLAHFVGLGVWSKTDPACLIARMEQHWMDTSGRLSVLRLSTERRCAQRRLVSNNAG